MTATHAATVSTFVDAHLEEVLEDLRTLVHLETPSLDVRLLRAALPRIEELVVGRLGAPAERVEHPGGERGDVLELAWPGTVDGEVLSVCHYDTVWPEGTVAEWPLRVEGDVVSGPGVLDMKAGLVQTVWMVVALRELGVPHPGLRLLLTGDEEIGSVVSREPILAATRRALVTLVAEPSAGGDVKVQRKGMVFADLTVRGVESHAGLDPEAGASAIHEMARLIPRVVALAAPQRGTTVNVGTIAGGSGRNVVAGLATAQVDVRVQDPAEAERVANALETLTVEDRRTTLEVVVDRNRPPMNPTTHTPDLLERVSRVAADLGVEIGAQPVGGASDGNFVADLGLPVIDGLGGIGAGPHARHEHVLASGLARQTALMAGIVETFA